MAKKKTTKKTTEKRPFKPADAKPLKPAKPVPPKRDQKPLGALSAASLVLKARFKKGERGKFEAA
jgi:hypothetical protein